jgi:hypothetical protein
VDRQFRIHRRTAEPGSADDGPGGGLARPLLSRRRVFRGAAGVAVAAGAAGGSALTGLAASPASASVKRAGVRAAVQGTTVAQGATAPAVVALADASTIMVDASLGNDFRVTIGASRTMGSPANPADGQKITFQITQGAIGSSTIAWGSDYEFSTGLPRPVLSTTPGQTDLLGFIYNAAKGKWLFVAFTPGFSSTTVTPPQGTYRLFPSTAGPSSPVSYSGPFLAGVVFEVTSGGTWLDGYWWWVCPSGQPTGAQTFALWAVYNDGIGTLVPGATVKSGPLTAGQWNYVPLTTPIPLAVSACYNACTGFSGSFPVTNSQFGSGQPYSAGIVTGPLSAFSDQSGSLPAPFGMPQGLFGVAGTDPTANMPADGSQSGNFWADIQVDTKAPNGASYRLWPNYPTLPGAKAVDTTAYTLGTEFQLSQSCTLDSIWFYSSPGVSALPSRCAIWDVSTQAVVSGTDNTSPSWTGAAGSGWVACAYSGVILPPGDYKVAVYSGGGSDWYKVTTGYWGNGGPGGAGITAGPLTVPGLADATSPGQGTYNPGSWAYPLTYGTAGDGENYWIDVEVTPS